MKKILLITTNIAPYRLRWCEELAKHFDVTICYTKDKEVERDKTFLKHGSDICHIIRLKNDKDDGSDPLCFDVLNVIKNNQDALIIFDGYGPKTNILGLAYCKIKKIKTFTNVDGYALGEKPSIIKEFAKEFVIKNLCDGFLCSSEVTKKHLMTYGIKSEKICSHNFSSVTNDRVLSSMLTKEEKNNIRKKLGIDYLDNIVLGVGQFIPRKRFEDLILAIKKCKTNCNLFILGGKPTANYLELTKDCDNVHFIDFVPPENVDDYYKAANLFVLSSQTDVWGLVLNEAMANGLPVISSDNCIAGLSMIKDNGVLYKTGNIEELSKAIDFCLNGKNNIDMSNKSLDIIKDYTIEKMVKKQLPYINKYFDKI